MTNHIHLLLTPRDASSCALMMKNLGQCYVQTTNKALGRSGTLWQGRFYSCLVPTEHYVLTCYRYIELNPVRAGMVSRPEDYPWSSHAANCAGNDNAPLATHPALKALGLDADERQAAYRALFDQPLEAPVLDEIRKATRNGHRLGMPGKRRRRGT